jgi:hypothetical protein
MQGWQIIVKKSENKEALVTCHERGLLSVLLLRLFLFGGGWLRDDTGVAGRIPHADDGQALQGGQPGHQGQQVQRSGLE